MPANGYPRHTHNLLPRLLIEGMLRHGATTHQQAALALGIGAVHFGRIMKGISVPDHILADRIATWTGYSADVINLVCGRLPADLNLSLEHLHTLKDTIDQMRWLERESYEQYSEDCGGAHEGP